MQRLIVEVKSLSGVHKVLVAPQIHLLHQPLSAVQLNYWYSPLLICPITNNVLFPRCIRVGERGGINTTRGVNMHVVHIASCSHGHETIHIVVVREEGIIPSVQIAYEGHNRRKGGSWVEVSMQRLSR